MNTSLTLEQGLEQFRDKNKELFSKGSISEEGEAFLKHHDVAHVLFACDTSIYGEGLVKIWITFGTTMPFWKVLKGYHEASAFELFRMYSFKHIAKNIFRYLMTIPKAISRSKKMSKPWPFSNYQSFMSVPLSSIRKEFNIEVIE